MQVSSHLYDYPYSLECLQLCSMPDVLEVCCVLPDPEVLLDFGVERMVRGDHQGGMVAHLAKVLQCLMGRGEGEEDGRWGRGTGRMYWLVEPPPSPLLSPPGCPPPPSLPETLQSPHKAPPNRTRSRENMQ